MEEGLTDLQHHCRRVNPRGQVLSHHRLLDKSEWCTILKFPPLCELRNLYNEVHLVAKHSLLPSKEKFSNNTNF